MKIEARRIGQYELQQLCRQDHNNETWRAYDTVTRRMVMLKLYNTDLLDTSATLASYLHRIEQLAALHHPNIVRIHDIQVVAFNDTEGSSSLICLSVEYIAGGSLADYIKSVEAAGRTPSPVDIVHLFSSLALATGSAYQHDFIHGNLKPTNILLSTNGEDQSRIGTPMLTDFAASKLSSGKYGNDLPFYLAPEQVKGTLADERSDVYALGVMLYQLYTGTLPFRGSRPIAVIMQHINAVPTSPNLVNPGLSPAVGEIILRCLAKNPQERFSNVSALAVALANALHVTIPANLSYFLALSGASLATEPAYPQSVPTEGSTIQSMPVAKRFPARKTKPFLVILSTILIFLVLGTGFEVLLISRSNAATASEAIGQASFVDSGQLNENTTQGISDELQIDLSHLPNLDPGQSYYAWLLDDLNQTEAFPLLLGRLTPNQGSVHFLYPGNSQHTNLLANSSRFLITVDSTNNPPSNPILDQSTWRYYTVLPQQPNPADALHFSMLDHLRHLLVESPELAIRGLHGGLAFWFVKDTATVSDLTINLAGDWQKQDASTIHNQIIRTLDYLDGTSFIGSDVPTGTPFLADSHIAQVALLGPKPQDLEAPGYVYQNQPPPGYVYLIQTHLNGAILSPQATPAQHQLAVQISTNIDSTRQELTQIYQDAKQLLPLSNAQLLQPSSLALLDQMATQAQDAYTGQSSPSTGDAQGGALWIYNNLQRLATFNVVPYTAPKAAS
jgi:eukaryotic-like serine/threonine-protein kinase